MKKIIYLVLVLIWMGIIFHYSNMPSYQSDEQSDKVIDSTVIKIAKFFKKDLTKEQEYNIYMHSIYPVRKYAHVFEFLVLYILVFLFINCFEIRLSNKLLYALLWCFIYAVGDEVHQLFVPGRTGRVIDVLIDMLGSSIGLLGCYIIKSKK
jgi:VanZ family protein